MVRTIVPFYKHGRPWSDHGQLMVISWSTMVNDHDRPWSNHGLTMILLQGDIVHYDVQIHVQQAPTYLSDLFTGPSQFHSWDLEGFDVNLQPLLMASDLSQGSFSY